MKYIYSFILLLFVATAASAAGNFVTFHGGLSTPAGQDYSKTKDPKQTFAK